MWTRVHGCVRGLRHTVGMTIRFRDKSGTGDQVTDADVDYGHVWKQTLYTLDSAGVSARDLAFVRLCRLVGVLDETAVVKAPNPFTKEFLETKVRDLVLDALRAELGEPVQLAVTVDETLGELGVDQMEGALAAHGCGPSVFDRTSSWVVRRQFWCRPSHPWLARSAGSLLAGRAPLRSSPRPVA